MKHWWGLGIFLVACAGTGTYQSPPLSSLTQNPPALPTLVPVPEKWEKAKFRGSSGLKELISQWIAMEQPSSFEHAAQEANRLLKKNGYPLALDARALLKKNQNKLELKAGQKIFTFFRGKELNSHADICGEQILKIPALPISEKTAAVISGGKKYPFSLAPFRRETVKIYRGKKLLSTIPLPEASEPIGISQNGKSIYIKFPLDEILTLDWWTRVVKNFPMVIGEDPYLVLRVERDRLSFLTDSDKLNPQEFEVQDSSSGFLHWRYLPSNLILELSSHCGQK